MNIGTQLIKDAMPELHMRYTTRLRAQSGKLLDFISRCERGKLNEEAFGEARMLAHSLCGSGTTFGFPEISNAARYLEDAIDCGPPHNPNTYIQLALELVRACDPAFTAHAEVVAGEAEADAPAPAVVERPMLLVVSDDQSMIAVMRRMFAARSEVIGTSDHEETFNLVKFGSPAAVIYDIGEDKPFAFLEALYVQARSQNIVLIAIAPNREAAALAHAVSAGTMQCLLRPLSVEKLYQAAQTTIERGRMLVLVGDDDVIVRQMITTRFKAFGFSVAGANDGAQVLDLAFRHNPSIIVLDRIMPGIEGVAVLRMLKANPTTRAIPVIMLSAKRKANEIADARAAGAADYIVKPFKPDQLVIRCMHELDMTPRPIAADLYDEQNARRIRRRTPRVLD